jgi:hypothetical protein
VFTRFCTRGSLNFRFLLWQHRKFSWVSRDHKSCHLHVVNSLLHSLHKIPSSLALTGKSALKFSTITRQRVTQHRDTADPCNTSNYHGMVGTTDFTFLLTQYITVLGELWLLSNESFLSTRNSILVTLIFY